jgi:Ca2+-binding RTX toxin-like protein
MAAPVVVMELTFGRASGTGFVTAEDVTGAYHVTDNPTGYGAPNDAFADFAHYVIIRHKNVNSVADEVLTLNLYNPLSATEFTATRTTDGHYEVTKLNIYIWSAGTYAADTVRYYAGSVYLSNTSTSQTPGAGAQWDVVTDLTEIEDNNTLIDTITGRVTVYDADVYWSKQIALNSQRGKCGICEDDRKKKKMDDILQYIQNALTADQLGYNTDGEWAVLALRLLGAKYENW